MKLRTNFFRLNKLGQALILEFRRPKDQKGSKFSTGQAMLSMVFLIGGMLLLIGITLAFLIYNFVHATFGFQAANRALGVALAGANDALGQLVINREFNVNGEQNCVYNFFIGPDKAAVTVIHHNSPCQGSMGLPDVNSNQIFVMSNAGVSGRGRKIEMIVSLDKITGEVSIGSLKQTGGWGGVECAGEDCNI